MSDILEHKLETIELWRKSNLEQLGLLEQWLKENDLASDVTHELISDMRARLLTEQLKVAFVAEFSRGKSELINAIFFASGGRRIMPASVGRTTMCPVEIGYDPKWPACIRLLPLETRLQDLTLAEWRYEHHDEWVSTTLDIDNPEQLAQAMHQVSERQFVTIEEASDLGLWDTENHLENPSTNAQGLVEVPKWRHAIVNYPHPLLKRGISILDTPGLNTVGVEPELTLDLLPQAHAVLFILAADTGVTRSDLQMWKDHLYSSKTASRPCYVLLNKIDLLWDDLLTKEQAYAQLEQQRQNCSALLGVPLEHVLPVSAQKGLLGKIKNNFDLLQESKLPLIERMLVRDLLPKRQQILHHVLTSGITELRSHIKERLTNKQQTLHKQLTALKELSGKNNNIYKQISFKIVAQKEALEALRKHASRLRTEEKRLLRQIEKRMGHAFLDKDLAEISIALHDPGMRLSLTKTFEAAMDALRKRAHKIEKMALQFEKLLTSHMQELESDYGITLTIHPSPGIGNLLTDIDMLHNRHESYFGMNQIIRLRRPQYAIQIFKTLLTRTRSIFDEAFDMLNMWSNNSYSILVVQVQDLEQSIKHLYEGVQRVQLAKEPLSERLESMEALQFKLFELHENFESQMYMFEHEAMHAHTPTSTFDGTVIVEYPQENPSTVSTLTRPVPQVIQEVLQHANEADTDDIESNDTFSTAEDDDDEYSNDDMFDQDPILQQAIFNQESLYKEDTIQDNQIKQEQIEKEQIEKEQIEKEQIEKEQIEKEQIEKEQIEKEQIEKEQIEQEQIEQEQIEQEQIEQEQIEQEQIEQEQIEQEQIEQEQIEQEQIEQEQIEQEQIEQEQIEQEQIEQEQIEQEQIEQEQIEQEQIEQEQIEQEQIEQEQIEQEQIEQEQIEQEQIEQEQIEQEQIEKD